MNILKWRKFWFGVSGVLLAASVASMIWFGFTSGIDFVGGTVLEVQMDLGQEVILPDNMTATSYLESTYQEATGEATAVQSSGENRFLLKSKSITNEAKSAWLGKVKTIWPDVVELRFESVSPTIGREVVNKAIFAVVLAVIAILLYVAYSFRRVPRPTSSWQFGAAAIMALGHDILILLGAYSLLGHFYGAEVDSMFVVALLTLLGFSVHDTIVTFDRLRENLIKKGGVEFERTMNNSVVETITRSINTSFTLVLVLLAMALMGGHTIFFFVLALLVGVVVGTYSSIFVASPLLLLWHKK
ncbi:MAG: protein translocase subunit SecF [Patescibacteria group bacterium]|nr:protein translocase subunit SecF [Patescibacteria group bacterium]